MDTPAAEVPIDNALVSSLVAAQHPSFSGPLELVASGWDNAIYRLGTDHAVRLPRRSAAVPLVEHEQRWLPTLVDRLPVAIPAPVANGRPGLGYPWPWSIVPWIEGVPADRTADRDALALPLAAVLRALHAPAPRDAPVNPVRGVPLATRDEAVQRRLRTVLLPGASLEALATAWQAGLAAPVFADEPRWLHGDLHPANVITRDGELAALIDFGDLCAGDPATDLAAAWLFFGPLGRSQFVAALDYDDAAWLRARAWAAALSLAILESSDDSPRMAAIARHGIAQLTAVA